MKTVLLKGLNDRDKEEMRSTFYHSAFLRNQLKSILAAKINDSNRQVRSKDAYGIANWAFLQADAVGYERAMTEVMSLLTHESGEASEVANAAEAPSSVQKVAKRRGRPPKALPPTV
jgi:hypothetical protein